MGRALLIRDHKQIGESELMVHSIFHFKETEKWLEGLVWFHLVADKHISVYIFIILIILVFVCKLWRIK